MPPLAKNFAPRPWNRELSRAIPGYFDPPSGRAMSLACYGATGVKVIKDAKGEPVLYPPTYESRFMAKADIPVLGVKYLHSMIVPILSATMKAWDEAQKAKGIEYALKHVGIFAPRAIRAEPSLMSWHSIAVAVDFNPDENPLQEPGKEMICDLPEEFISIFTERGWTWGGMFKGRKDPMHFQFLSGA